MEKITPSDEELLDWILLVKSEIAELSYAKLAAEAKVKRPHWVVSEKRMKKTLQV